MASNLYNETLAYCAALLVLKNMINHLLVVRIRLFNRLKGDKYGNYSETPEADPKNWKFMPHAFFYVFYYGLLAFGGPFLTENYFDRFQSMERNAVENEPFFLALAAVWSYAPGDMPEWAPKALLVFTYARIVHFILFAFLQIQPWRAIAWTVGVVVNVVMAVNVLLGFAAAKGTGGGEL